MVGSARAKLQFYLQRFIYRIHRNDAVLLEPA